MDILKFIQISMNPFKSNFDESDKIWTRDPI